MGRLPIRGDSIDIINLTLFYGVVKHDNETVAVFDTKTVKVLIDSEYINYDLFKVEEIKNLLGLPIEYGEVEYMEIYLINMQRR